MRGSSPRSSYTSAYYQANKDAILEKNRAYYEAKREKILAQRRERYARRKAAGEIVLDSEAYAEQHRRWVAANPEKYKAIKDRRRAAKRGVESTLTHEEWTETLEAFGYSCAYCLRRDAKLTMDHIVPLSKGGPHRVDNVVPACVNCNSRKADKTLLEVLGARLIA